MKEKCPGLPNWEALKGCAEAFSTPETAPKGRYLGGPVTWGGFDDERVEALDLPFEVVHAGTDAAMFAELESAYQRKAPIILWIYTPHWAPAKFKGEWVQFPEWTPECYNDPAWGSNPDKAYDCGKPHGEIYKYSWKGFAEKWPVAHKIAKNMKFSDDEMNQLIGQGRIQPVMSEVFSLEHVGDAGIVYCQSRKKVEETAEWLSAEGIPALPYHAGLEAERRRREQSDVAERRQLRRGEQRDRGQRPQPIVTAGVVVSAGAVVSADAVVSAGAAWAGAQGVVQSRDEEGGERQVDVQGRDLLQDQRLAEQQQRGGEAAGPRGAERARQAVGRQAEDQPAEQIGP